MSERRFLNAYELGEIVRRHELANDGNPLRDLDVLNAMYDSLDDIPKLLEEVNELNYRVVKSDGLLAEAYDLLGDVHCYDTDVFEDITKYFYGEELTNDEN